MSTPMTLSLLSATLAMLLFLSHLKHPARWRMRVACIFAAAAVWAALYDVGVIRAYDPPARPCCGQA